MVVTRFHNRITALRLREQQDGQGLVEYALILLLVALAVIAALAAFGGDVGILYENINTKLPF